jgi:hypothetical protein
LQFFIGEKFSFRFTGLDAVHKVGRVLLDDAFFVCLL